MVFTLVTGSEAAKVTAMMTGTPVELLTGSLVMILGAVVSGPVRNVYAVGMSARCDTGSEMSEVSWTRSSAFGGRPSERANRARCRTDSYGDAADH